MVQITGALNNYECRSDESRRRLKAEFCPSCGTTVTWTAKLLPGARGIAGGTFDDPDWIKPTVHGWTRSALHWMVFPSGVEIFKTTSPDWQMPPNRLSHKDTNEF
jgi:hypothetical protein